MFAGHEELLRSLALLRQRQMQKLQRGFVDAQVRGAITRRHESNTDADSLRGNHSTALTVRGLVPKETAGGWKCHSRRDGPWSAAFGISTS